MAFAERYDAYRQKRLGAERTAVWRHFSVPGTRFLTRLIRSFSPIEKKAFAFLVLILFVSTAAMLVRVNEAFSVTIPRSGGTFVEGVVGTPRFINPLLATSDAERDLNALVYSGLMRATPHGELKKDLAASYEISEDGTVYTFTLKEGLSWHDGEPVTAEDVVFTIQKVQDATLRSPRRASWEGVAAETLDEQTVRFTLDQPYSPFLENTTLGIIPKHIWGELDAAQFSFSRYNTEPIGTGPYKVANINKDRNGIPQYYELEPFTDTARKAPYITTIRIRFYADETEMLHALQSGAIDAASAVSPERIRTFETSDAYRVHAYDMPRVLGVFFNQNRNDVFAEKAVRSALSAALDREKIVQTVLAGYGTPLDGPLPPGALGYQSPGVQDLRTLASEERTDHAAEMLREDGWTLNEETGIRTKGGVSLSFSLATANTPELKQAASMVQSTWEDIGARVNLEVYGTSDLNRAVIRPREYDALFFGHIVGREADPFAFWHSSQRNDPGLNIAQYTNISVDNVLEEARRTTDRAERARLYQEFTSSIREDIPAAFVYAPDFIYITSAAIHDIDSGTITIPAERFLDVHSWYINTDTVWRIFAPREEER